MKRFEGNFLKDKYWGNKEFRQAAEVSARRMEKREGEKVPNKPQERIENYLDRFSEVTDREDPEKREHGIAAIERLVEKKYIIKPEKISDEYIKMCFLAMKLNCSGMNEKTSKMST